MNSEKILFLDRTNSKTDIGTDRTKNRLCPCLRYKNNTPKRCILTGQTRRQNRLCPRTDNL
nr:MAG TPA: hypothetical protein [Siphoviridae sp. cte3s7]